MLDATLLTDPLNVISTTAIRDYRSGPPGGRQLPRAVERLADAEGGVFGINEHSRFKTDMYVEERMEVYRLLAENGDGDAQVSEAVGD